MKLNGMIGKDRAGKTFPLTLGWAFSIGGLATALLLALSPILYAQSSPLTVQPSTGRVGVGNTNPGYTLDVTGTVNATGFRGDGSQLTNLPGGGSQWTTNGSNIYYNNGNVGIGTTNPGAKLHISGSGENGLFINSSSHTRSFLMGTNQGGGAPYFQVSQDATQISRTWQMRRVSRVSECRG